jgi:hypothetical protein
MILAMIDLEKESENLLVWAAEEAFSLQLLAALCRIGKAVQPLARSKEGHQKVSSLHPKVKIIEKISDLEPDFKEAKILWAPENELFSNSPLSKKSINEVETLISLKKKLIIASSHNSFEQLKAFQSQTHLTVLYLPALVGFGDENFFESIFESILDCDSYTDLPSQKLLSLKDAASLMLSLVLDKDKKFPTQIWCEGIPLFQNEIIEGLQDYKKVSPQNIIVKKLRDFLGKNKKWEIQEPLLQKPQNIPSHKEIFPTLLTPWKRFFKESFRVYETTRDGNLLLHFPPSRAP